MRNAVVIVMVAVSALAVIVVVAAWLVLRAVHQTPSFYERALLRDPALEARSCNEFLQQALALASDIEQRDRWQIAFSEDQINGWLAVDVPRNLPELLPPEVSDPRVHIAPGELTIACRLKNARVDAVISLSADIFSSAPDEVAIRIRRATVGALRAPLAQVLGPLSHALEELNLPTVWRQQDGDPVLVIQLGSSSADSRDRVELEAIELEKGQLLIAGRRAERSKKPARVAQEDAELPREAAATKSTRQR